jgi:signal transduction histidine kinase/CheY-like chemotaxis protein
MLAAAFDAVKTSAARRLHAVFEHTSQELMDRAVLPRFASAFGTAVIAGYWLGPVWGFSWLSLVALWERVGIQQIYRRLIVPHIETDPLRGQIIGLGMVVFGAALYGAIWIAAWAKGGSAFAFFGAIMMCATFIHALTYLSTSTLLFIICAVPSLVGAVAMSLAAPPPGVPSWLMLLGVGIAVFVCLVSRHDRNALARSLGEAKARRQAAEQASLAKSQFLATMSHELRTPLNAVIGYAEILEEDLGAEGREASAADAARIRRAARDLLGLINEVLDLSKIEAGRMEVTPGEANIPEIVADVAETTAHIAAANGDKVVVQIEPHVGVVVADGGKVRQCLLNLVSNACKFTQQGSIHMHVDLLDRPEGAMLRLVVADTGVGIEPEQAKRLFQPFVQADVSHTRKQGGTGLGLVITRRLAQLMGGDVTLESAPGRGSTFTLTLAVERPQAGRPDTSVANGPLVLLIEDEAAARDLCVRALSRLPLRVIAAATAAEGAALAAAQRPALIVLDIHLPDRKGWDLLAEFKADPNLRDVPVLVLTIDDDRARAMALGACEHLVKPVDRDRLAAAAMRFVRAPASAPAAAAKTARHVA